MQEQGVLYSDKQIGKKTHFVRKHQIQTTNEMPKLQAEYPIFETQLKIHGTKQNEI